MDHKTVFWHFKKKCFPILTRHNAERSKNFFDKTQAEKYTKGKRTCFKHDKENVWQRKRMAKENVGCYHKMK